MKNLNTKLKMDHFLYGNFLYKDFRINCHYKKWYLFNDNIFSLKNVGKGKRILKWNLISIKLQLDTV